MLGNFIYLKSQSKELTLQNYYEVVDYLLKHGEDKEIYKFFLALNSFGMTKKEVLYLTLALRDSGKILKYNQTIFEKHSTGGIGDSTSVVLVPLIASLGYKIIKTTGKSMMYTNGSTDRFCSIPNFNVDLTEDEIETVLTNTNACVLSHGGEICPADKVLYNIRETCGLEKDMNLLAASIACKKLACGAKIVLVDIKFGEASVVKTYKEALKLANLLKYIFKKSDVDSVIVITDTIQTIGEGIGNAIEVVDALNVLQGKKTLLRDVSVTYACEMILKANPKLERRDVLDMINASIDNGVAYITFLDIIRHQGGDFKLVGSGGLFKPYKSVNFTAEKEGYVGYINALVLGEMTRRMCAITHDNNLGVVLRVKIGDYVKQGDIILSFYYKDDSDLKKYSKVLSGCIRTTKEKVEKAKIIKKVIR